MATLSGLEPDSLVHMADHLGCTDIVNLSATCHAMKEAVRLNQTLWASLYTKSYGRPGRPFSGASAWAPHTHSWHDIFVRTHSACHQVTPQLR